MVDLRSRILLFGACDSQYRPMEFRQFDIHHAYVWRSEVVGVPMMDAQAPDRTGSPEDPTRDLYDYLGLLRRRKTTILMVSVFLLAASVAVAFLLPAVYRSTATILIEEQEIPPDLVRSAIASYADQRIETIKQQVLSRSTLWRIVEQYDLYKNLRQRKSTEEILERLIEDIQVNVMNVKVIDKRT